MKEIIKHFWTSWNIFKNIQSWNSNIFSRTDMQEMNFFKFWETIEKECPQSFPKLKKLKNIFSVIPLTTVPCESAFSIMNKLKNKFRSSLKVSNLSTAMKIIKNNVEWVNIDKELFFDLWKKNFAAFNKI